MHPWIRQKNMPGFWIITRSSKQNIPAFPNLLITWNPSFQTQNLFQGLILVHIVVVQDKNT